MAMAHAVGEGPVDVIARARVDELLARIAAVERKLKQLTEGPILNYRDAYNVLLKANETTRRERNDALTRVSELAIEVSNLRATPAQRRDADVATINTLRNKLADLEVRHGNQSTAILRLHDEKNDLENKVEDLRKTIGHAVWSVRKNRDHLAGLATHLDGAC